MTRAERIASWTRPAVRDLSPYYAAPLDGNPLRLDQNTNLWGRNPALDQVTVPDVDQYPTRDADGLMAALAQWHHLAPENFVAGNGSDEVIDLLTKAFAAPGQTLATTAPGYSLYPFYARLQELKLKQVPLDAKFGLDVDGLIEAQAALTLVASPNNPTGNRFRERDLVRLLDEIDGIVVVDEAYIEYAGLSHSMISRVEEFDNLAVMRTFSKAYGLAGLRVGYLAGNAELVAKLRLVKPPFNLSTYAEAVAIAALEAQEWVDQIVAGTVEERERLAAGLKKRGLRPHPSDANFILCDCDDPSGLLAALRQQGILARTFPGAHGLEHGIRFTVGRPEHTDALLSALEAP